jgi:hypothetical protein
MNATTRIDRRTTRQLHAIETRIKGAGYRKASRKSTRKHLRRRPSTPTIGIERIRDYAAELLHKCNLETSQLSKQHRLENFEHNYKPTNKRSKDGGYRYTLQTGPGLLGDSVQKFHHTTTVGKGIRTPHYFWAVRPKMSGMIVQGIGDELENILPEPAARPSDCNGIPYRNFGVPVFSTDTKLRMVETRREITRQVWKNGQKDIVEDVRFDFECRKQMIHLVALSNRIEFATDINEPETEKQTIFRLDCCKRWTAIRFDTNPKSETFGQQLPIGTTIKTADGREIPDIRDSEWILKNGSINPDSVHRYITAAIRHAFASFAGQLRHVYGSYRAFTIFQEFRQDCLNEISCNFRQCLKGLKHYRGTCDGLRTVTRQYMLSYCIRDNEKSVDVSPLSQKVKKNVRGRECDVVAAMQAPKFYDSRIKRIYELQAKGHSQEETGKLIGLSVETVRREMKKLIDFNAR